MALTIGFIAWKLPPIFPGCVPENLHVHIWAYWVPSSVFQGVILYLAINKIWEIGKQNWHTPKLLEILLRDSLAYLGGAIAIIMVNVLIWSVGRVRLVKASFFAEPVSDQTCS